MDKRGVTGEARPASSGVPDESALEGVLGDLIEVEHRIRASVREAEAEAARAIAEAESQASARAQQHDDALDTAVHELQAGLERRQSVMLAEIARRSDAAVRRHREVDEARVRVLAELVATCVAEDDLESEELEPGGSAS